MDTSNKKSIISIPEFWEIVLSKLYPPKRRKRYADGLMRLMKKYAIISSSHILDAGCGIGFPLIDLVKRGYKNIVGVDKSRAMIRKCRQNALKADVKIQTMVLPWSALSKTFGNVFDFIYCRGNSLAAAASWGKTSIAIPRVRGVILNTLKNFYHILKTDRCLYVDVIKPDELKTRGSTLWKVKKENEWLTIKGEIEYDYRKKVRTITDRILFKQQEQVIKTHVYLFTQEELKSLLKMAGFNKVQGPVSVMGEWRYNVFIAQK